MMNTTIRTGTMYKVTQQTLDEDTGKCYGYKTLGTFTNDEQAVDLATKAMRKRNPMTEGKIYINNTEF